MAKKNENDDILNKYIANETSAKSNQTEIVINEIRDNNTMKYLNVDIQILPCSYFYKKGTQIKIRAASVSEIQAFSVVDDNNLPDIVEKLNEMLKSCVKYIHPSGSFGSYRDLRDQDRIFLIFMIRELTFQSNNTLSKNVECEHCKNEVVIPYRATPANTPRTFQCYEMNEELIPYYDDEEGCFKFEIKGKIWKLAPPSIGIQETFYKDIKSKVAQDENIKKSFLKVIPFTLWDRNTISEDGIKAKEKEYKTMDDETFNVLNHAIDLMNFGIKELKIKCPQCDPLEVVTKFVFPTTFSNLFNNQSILDRYFKKQIPNV